ncbi:hypothetical protein [Roseospira navarrensis]|uniref:Uncharacterized protein n=1 Tax=Roseospira navarrensis TaxID=140058 RepID=A0A7X1ZED8_9PROT|nr:hypothetical protein [Roseospira navarrensis]MQX36061.1 hypothetical protein [Roseospira navarrensis]
MLKSNRLTMDMSDGDRTIGAVVRGHNISGTLRLAAAVAERFLRDPGVFEPDPPYPPDWTALWNRKVSSYERRFNRDNWASLHVGGQTVFATHDSDTVRAIEKLAEGADLDEKTLRAATSGLFGDITSDDIVVQHDSQTAVVFTPFPDYLRAAVLERKGGRTGSFSVAVRHSEQHQARPNTVLTFCADVIECLNLRQFLERAPGATDPAGGPASAGPSGPQETVPQGKPDAGLIQQIEAAKTRRRELSQYVEGFEHANRVQYRPERPNL